MKHFNIKSKIVIADSAEEFCSEFKLGFGDLMFVSNGIYERFFKNKTNGAYVVNYRKYGNGEPTDKMVECIYNDIREVAYERVIAVGGGTILDVAKLFALKNISPVCDLFEKKLEICKDKELILVPTTCGTGSEVTNISILELTAKNTKFGLAVPELYADYAVLIPELTETLPFRYFSTSSIDALIHAFESFTSPKANEFTKMYSLRAIDIILNAYKKIQKYGEDARKDCIKNVLLASTYAGIAFGNAGCAAVHAMSYPLGAAYHIAHGEANYAVFTEVYKTYLRLSPNGIIDELNAYVSDILNCDKNDVYDELDKLLGCLIDKKRLSEYGVKKEELDEFTATVITKQGRLMANNYTELDEKTVRDIYEKLY